MAVSVVLAMWEPVSIRDLRFFLSLVGDEADLDVDIRSGFTKDKVGLLAFDLPIKTDTCTGPLT